MAAPSRTDKRASQDTVPKKASLDNPRDVAPPSPSTSSSSDDVHYTVFIRVPLFRRDFVDPPLVDWDASKDKALWKILSRNPRSADIDWKALATKFDVTLPFILQQAAWLYERQLSQVRAQMRRVSRTSLNAAAQSNAIVDETREAKVAGSRRPSTLSVQTRAQALEKLEGSTPGTPRPTADLGMVRTTSTSTVTQSRVARSSRLHQTSRETIRRPSFVKPLEPANRVKEEDESVDRPRSRSTSPPSSSSASSASESENVRRAPIRPISRFARGRNAMFKSVDSKKDSDDDDEEEGDEVPAFLPQQTEKNRKDTRNTRGQVRERAKASFVSSPGASSPEEAKAESSSKRPEPSGNVASGKGKLPQASKPSTTPSQKYAMSPAAGTQGKQYNGKQASEGTPSMGSSFSDLDGA
ncbi:MAG: hypothetical protein M1831_007279 [Alyxoria varia]|nr:MAG: hypothetical protein M1831_007279 [Alyxoria varia]